MNEVGPVAKKEAEWVRHREDVVTLRCGREHAWLDAGIEHLLKFFQHKVRAKPIVEVSNASPYSNFNFWFGPRTKSARAAFLYLPLISYSIFSALQRQNKSVKVQESTTIGSA